MKISDLGFPDEFLDLMDGKDYELYPHQEEAINEFRKGNNVLVTVPTASGKTLIAYSAIYEKFEKKQISIYIVPLKALAMEKYEELRKLERLGIKVALSIGDYDSSPAFIKKYDVVVCTSEKADSMFHHDPSILYDVGLIVADEVHMIGDPSRGPRLEMVLSSALYVNPDIAILSLSATISNADEVSKWLNASLVRSDFRPVPLSQGIIHKREIIHPDGESEILHGKNEVFAIIEKHISDGGQVLIFVNSRKRAEELSKQVAASFEGKYAILAEKIPEPGNESDRYDEYVRDLVLKGASFHHAGLSTNQRSMIESLFKSGDLKVIVATPTLAAGVNLPARVVIIRDITRFSEGYVAYISNIEVQQMLGRAGRPKYDTQGYAYIYAQTDRSLDKAMEYIEGAMEPLESNLGEISLLRFNMLALVSTGISTDIESIMKFYQKTLYGMQNDIRPMENIFSETLEFLKVNDFIRDSYGTLKASSFGKLVSDLYIDPKSAIILRDYFDKKHSNDLALYYICKTPDILTMNYRNEDIPSIEYFMENNEIFDDDPEAYRAAKTAMVLKDWIEEVPMQRIIEKFNIGPGDVQGRVSSADWISYSLARLSSMFKPEIRKDLEHLNMRIKEGVREEIINLTFIPNIGRVRARRLYNAGLRTLSELSSADISQISAIYGFSDKMARDIISYSKKIEKRVGT